MADWTTIPDSSIEPGKPIRSIDGLALRDNPVAIAEGAVGAPRLQGRGAKYINNYPVLTVSASDDVSVSAGSNVQVLSTSTTSTANPPTVVAIRYTIATYTGSIRFKASHAMSNDSGFASRLSVFKNNTLIQAYTTTSQVLQLRTNDISVVPGDVIEWRHSTSSSGSATLTNRISETASDGYTARPLYIAFSEVTRP